MEKQNNISIGIWSAKSEVLLEKVAQIFEEIKVDKNILPRNIFEENKAPSLVLAGQYSAGKSTILKALTGIESIATGQKITTQKSEFYDWNGLKIIDTPGIHTTLCPKHDEIAYETISNADMLIYVITQELFDSYIGNNFRKLLFDKDKAGEMILLVNKMADIGNTLENKLVKLEGIKIVTQPYLPEDLRVCFIDAESYLDSLAEEDIEIAEELLARSNYEGLVDTINKFVEEKAMTSKLTTILYKIYDVLQKTIAEFETSSGDVDVDATEEHLFKEKRIYFSTKLRIEQRVKSIYEEAEIEIRDIGRDIANSISDYSSEDEANDAVERAYNKVNQISEKCKCKIVEEITMLEEECRNELDAFYETDFSQKLKIRLNEKYKKGNPIVQRICKSDILGKGGSEIVSRTIGNKGVGKGLQAFGGSDVHKIVLDVGKFFGYKFKPWEAIKLVEKINVVGKVLGAFGVVLSVGMQVKEDVDESKYQEAMKSNREKLRTAFNSAANEVSKEYSKALNDYLRKSYTVKISEIDERIRKIQSLRIGESENCKLLEGVQSECKSLIQDIHKAKLD